MREIIFRGKQVKDGKWTEGYYCPKPYSHFPCEPTIFPFDTINKDWHGERVDPETVGQYTGLTDKNGNRIFEGDILGGFLDEDYPEHKTIVVVEFYENMWVTRQGKCHQDLIEEGDMDWFEVIGNIYDNPEMLKGGVEND